MPFTSGRWSVDGDMDTRAVHCHSQCSVTAHVEYASTTPLAALYIQAYSMSWVSYVCEYPPSPHLVHFLTKSLSRSPSKLYLESACVDSTITLYLQHNQKFLNSMLSNLHCHLHSFAILSFLQSIYSYMVSEP